MGRECPGRRPPGVFGEGTRGCPGQDFERTRFRAGVGDGSGVGFRGGEVGDPGRVSEGVRGGEVRLRGSPETSGDSGFSARRASVLAVSVPLRSPNRTWYSSRTAKTATKKSLSAATPLPSPPTGPVLGLPFCLHSTPDPVPERSRALKHLGKEVTPGVQVRESRSRRGGNKVAT